MPVRGKSELRLTRSERAALQRRAENHGQGEYVPEAIRSEEALSAAESIANGEALIPDLFEYVTSGSSGYQRGERSLADLFGGDGGRSEHSPAESDGDTEEGGPRG